jgi:hypothetical protein
MNTKLLKKHIRKMISEQFRNSYEERFWTAAEKTPKYKKFSEIIKANPDAEYFTYTSKKDGQKKKMVFLWAFGHICIRYRKYKSKTTILTRPPIELYNDMEEDLKPSATKKRKGLGNDSYGRNLDSVFNIKDNEERSRVLQELQKKYDNLKAMVKQYGNGYYTYLNTKDNRKYKIRLFISTGGSLGIFQKNKSRYGYPFGPTSELMMYGKDFQPIKQKLTSPEEKLYNVIAKLKTLWTTKVHPNLWKKEVDIWKTVDMNEVRTQCEILKGNHYQFWEWFNDKYNTGSDLIYKTTTVDTWKPRGGYDGNYRLYKQNIKKHLSNKENFSYHWQSGYSVSVNGNSDEGGEYRAWFSLEYKGMGNGHYYYLINENLALFMEDD